MVRIISEEEIDAHLPLADSIDAMETAHEEMAEGRAVTTFMESKVTEVQDPPADATDPTLHELRTLDAAIEVFQKASVRINSDIVHWPTKDGARVRDKLPATDGQYNGYVNLFDTSTGELLALFPDAIVQHFRVAGSSALGAKYLANEDASVLGMLGAGWQARSHLPALDIVLDLDHVRVYSPTPSSRKGFVEEMREEVSPTVEAVDTPEQVFDGADVIQCVTNASEEPVFELDWIEPGQHISLIRVEEAPDGFFSSDVLDVYGKNFPEVIQYQLYGPEYRENRHVRKTWNNYVSESAQPHPRLERYRESSSTFDFDDQAVTLGELVADESRGRQSPDGVSGFNVAGLPLDFTAVGHVLYEIAAENDLGVELSTDLLSQQHHP
jgi:ornithine cyclodeaminase/alanine dehydrogenase-like protein (mu-crystallin family)